MGRLTTSTWLRAVLPGLVCGSAILSAAAAYLLAGRSLPGTESWQVQLMEAALAILAATWLVVALRVLNRVGRSLGLLRERIAAVVAGGLPSDNYSGELSDLHQSFGAMVEQLQQARREHEQSQQRLAARTRTVDRLLEFSQTIQGAGRVDQIFPTLCHFLQSELGLPGVAVLGHEPEPGPGVQVRAVWPERLLDGPPAEFDTALCPCMRQSQPRAFRAGDSPVRCTIDKYLTLPASHEAYCIPFSVGRRSQFVLHMLLPIGQSWTEERRQLAQTYANTAQSALTSLFLLEEAEKQSVTDGLTGLFNRRSMDALLQREVALAERHQQPLSIVMVDMDYFKQINDTHGHAAGDHLLRAFADCVRITLRKTDLAFRYGGDEFVIALPQTPIAQAQQVVSKLRQAFGSVDFSSAIANLQTQPTLSIGLAERSVAINLLTLQSLLSAADQALYDAKTISRNCVRVYQPPRAA